MAGNSVRPIFETVARVHQFALPRHEKRLTTLLPPGVLNQEGKIIGPFLPFFARQVVQVIPGKASAEDLIRELQAADLATAIAEGALPKYLNLENVYLSMVRQEEKLLELAGQHARLSEALMTARVKLTIHTELSERLRAASSLVEIEEIFMDVLLKHVGAKAVKVYEVDDELMVAADCMYRRKGEDRIEKLTGADFTTHFTGGLRPDQYKNEIMGAVLLGERGGNILVVPSPKDDPRCYRGGQFLRSGPFLSIREDMDGKPRRVYFVEVDDPGKIGGECDVTGQIRSIHQQILYAKTDLLQREAEKIIEDIREAARGLKTVREAVTGAVKNIPRLFRINGEHIIDKVTLLLPSRTSGNLVVREEWINPKSKGFKSRKGTEVAFDPKEAAGVPVSWIVFKKGIPVRCLEEKDFSGAFGVSWRQERKGSLLGIPIGIKGQDPFGVIIVSSSKRNTFTDQHQAVLGKICDILGIAFLEIRRLDERLNLDPTFGIAYTKGHLKGVLMPSLIAESPKKQQPLSAIYFDIDFFKDLNDLLGNDVVDKWVLLPFMKLVYGSLRQGNVFGRDGGDEFCVLCPGENIEGAYQTSERLRRLVGESVFEAVIPFGGEGARAVEHYDRIKAKIESGAPCAIKQVRKIDEAGTHRLELVVRLTLSSGVTEYKYGEEQDVFFSRLVQASRKAKNAGRDRTAKRK